MNKEELTKYMEQHPWSLRQGAATTAKRTHSLESDVRQVRASIQKRKMSKQNRNLKILIFDIETSPLKAYVWKRFKENISLDQTISEWFMLAWSAKWLYSSEVLGEVLTPEEVKNEDDFRIVNKLWELINEADIVVSHNGNNFDIPRINSRFIINNLPPTKSFVSIDTCAIVKKQFGFSSNKLDALAEYFGFDHKLDTSFELWKKCMEGDDQSLKYMLTYNKRDVTLLEEVYLKLRPYIKNHPNCSNFSLEQNKMMCCNCASTDYEEIKDKFYFTQVGKYKLYRCKNCGAVFRGRSNQNVAPLKVISTLR